jgi:ubiquinone/menaquinone biosynthesis C-methylase UbiE
MFGFRSFFSTAARVRAQSSGKDSAATTEMPVFDPRSFFTGPLYDLGEVSSVFSGILAPEAERGIAKVGISEGFLENAAEYHARHASSDIEGYANLYKDRLTAAGVKTGVGINILDIGAGSGSNTTIPLSRVFPGSKIIATDLSPQLLAILQSQLKTLPEKSNVACVCMDAMNDFISPNSMDIVVGGAILHHLLEPFKAVQVARKVLKNGGVAVFSEPFEYGHLVLGSTLKQILALQDKLGALKPEVANFFSVHVSEWLHRAGRHHSPEYFINMDDKWLFTRKFMHEMAIKAGFKDVLITTLTPNPPFVSYTKANLQYIAPNVSDLLPEWAWDMIGELDRTITDELKDELIFVATVVFRA